MTIPQEAIKLIVDFEVGDKAYYNKHLIHPDWPGGSSGVTIGIGYDVGYESSFESDWSPYLSAKDVSALARCKGLTGSAGRAARANVADIVVPWDSALKVFADKTLPKYIAQTISTFPNSDKLPPLAIGVLVSIIFNRGALIDNSDRRKEMKAIRNILLQGNDRLIDHEDVQMIAEQVKSMARLWPDNSDSDGDLHDRRLAEAKMILASLN